MTATRTQKTESDDDQRGRERPNRADREASERTRKVAAADRPGHPEPQRDVREQVERRTADHGDQLRVL